MSPFIVNYKLDVIFSNRIINYRLAVIHTLTVLYFSCGIPAGTLFVDNSAQIFTGGGSELVSFLLGDRFRNIGKGKTLTDIKHII